SAACVLVQTGLDQPRGLPILRAFMKDKNPLLRLQAGLTLAVAGQDVADVIPMVLEGLRHERHAVKLHSIDACRVLGDRAVKAGPVLVELLLDPALCDHASGALQIIPPDPKLVFPPLAKLIKHSDPIVRLQVVIILNRYGPLAVRPLLEAIED